MPFLQTHKRISLILFLALIIRFIPACLFFGSWDSLCAKDVYYDILKTGNLDLLYGGQAYKHPGLPHFPGWIWMVWLIGFFSERTGIPHNIVFKFPAIFADLAITILLYKAFLRSGLGLKKSSSLAAIYALNPVVILVTAVNGQFDIFIIFFVLLAWYFYKFSNRFRIESAMLLGIGVIIKEFPAMLFPAFWGKLKQLKERVGYAAWFSLPILIALAIAYFTTTLRFIPFLLKYNSTTGFWGFSLISKYLLNNIRNSFFHGFDLFVAQYMRYISLGAIVLGWLLCFKKRDALTSILLIFTIFYFFAPGLGVQYLVWVIPFAVLNRDAMLKFYTIFVSIAALLWFIPVLITDNPAASYNSIKWLNFTRNLFSVFGWATTGIWMYRLLKIHWEV